MIRGVSPKNRAVLSALAAMAFCWHGVVGGRPAVAQGRPDFIWKEGGPAYEDSVNDVVFSPDGRFVASAQASEGRRVMVRRATDGAVVREISPMGYEPYAVAFSPDSTILAIAELDITLWRVSDWSLIRTLDRYAQTLAFSPDGRLLASGGGRLDLLIWRVSDGALLHTLTGHRSSIRDVEFSPDGSLLASGSSDETAILWRVSDGSPVRTITDHSDYVLSVAFSPDGQTLATGGLDYTIRLWHVEDGSFIRLMSLPHRGGRFLDFSPDGEILLGVAQFYYGIVGFWRVADGTLVQYYDEGMGQRPEVAAFSPDGATFACGGRNGWTGVARSPFPGDGCGRIEDTSCRDRRGVNRLEVLLADGTEGDAYTVTLSDGSMKSGTVNARGKGRAKFSARPDGDTGTATAVWGCGAEDTRDYSCPSAVSDTCDSAIRLSLPALRSGSTREATIDESFPACGQGTEVIAPGVWYKVMGTGQWIEANTCTDANFNTKINVYEEGCAAPVCVVGNNNICGDRSAVVWPSAADVEYLILVHGTLDEVGEFVLSVREADDVLDCQRIAALDLACDSGNETLTATLFTSLPEGRLIDLTLNDTIGQQARVGNRGIAVAVFQNIAPGEYKVCVDGCAEICESVSCP